ncbi:MAG: metallophosphoesterase [Clostridia bacterium]|nr:metallophosphoesterase [Clostridia bacterium]
MTYVVSNLHGNYAKFKELLKTINFKDTDLMYILGDVVDYGDESMELVGDLSIRYNVYPIVGEHDYTAVRMLSGFEKMLKSGETPDKKFISEMTAWVADGGQSTLDSFRTLDAEMKEGIIDYLSDMTLYEEIEVGGKEYLLVHAGIAGFKTGVDLEELKPEAFFSEALDLTKKYFDDKTIIVGHTPTTEDNGGDGKIFFGNGSIAIDCGEARGGTVGCLRLEDLKEFYV